MDGHIMYRPLCWLMPKPLTKFGTTGWGVTCILQVILHAAALHTALERRKRVSARILGREWLPSSSEIWSRGEKEFRFPPLSIHIELQQIKKKTMAYCSPSFYFGSGASEEPAG
jgi:hypothetical protein